MSGTRLLVLGVGNDFRCDDAVGLFVARRLQELTNAVDVVETSGDGTEMLEAWQGRDDVIIVDAMRSGAAPGTLRRLEAGNASIPSTTVLRSTHAMGVREAVELSRALGTLPSKVTLYLIEGESFGTGAEMSVPVQQAAREAVRMIEAEWRTARQMT